MKVSTPLNQGHVGKFTVINAGSGRHLAVRITAIKDDLCTWEVLDKDIPLRLGLSRFRKTDVIDIYDTPKDALNWENEV